MKFETYQIDSQNAITIPRPENHSDVFELIKSDLYRCGKKNVKQKDVLLIIMKLDLLAWFRLASIEGRISCKIYRKIYLRLQKSRHIDLPYNTKVGYGLYLGHAIDMVVNGGTIIGNNCNLSQFLNIGTNHNTPAIIGDNVYIGPMVCIVEDVAIGSNATIGAGSVVVKSIPANSTAVGVPAKVVNYNNPSRYINNQYVIPQNS